MKEKNLQSISFDEMEAGVTDDGQPISADDIMGDPVFYNKKNQPTEKAVDELKDLLDKPDEKVEKEEYEKDISEMTPPPGVSQEVIENVRSKKVDTRLYDYNSLVEKIKNEPVKEKVPMFITELDNLLDGGLQGGELLILSAPTKNGKTTFAQTTSYLQADKGVPSVWFTLEMSWQELTRKFMAMDWEMEMTNEPSNLPIYYPIDNRSISMDWLEEQILKAKERNNAKIVYIDHLHFLVPLDTKKSNISFLVGGIVRQVKQIAVKLDIPIVLIAHTKKIDVNVNPDINSMRDSSFIAQESDFTLVMWRERLKQKKGEEDKEVYTSKTNMSLEANRRNGKTKKFPIGMINGRFHDYDTFLSIKYSQEEDKIKDGENKVEGFNNEKINEDKRNSLF